MVKNRDSSGSWIKAPMAALAVAILSVPLAGALAMPSGGPEADEAVSEEPVVEEVVVEEAVVEETAVEGQVESAGLSEEQMAEARSIFMNWSCGACHVLGDANGTGHIGPQLDGNDAMDEAFIISRVTDGQGAMPGFGGQLTDDEIALLATYIMAAKQ